MKRIRLIGRCLGIASIAVLISAFVGVSRAYPEAYIGGQFGMALPSIGGGLKNIQIDSSLFLPGTTHSDLELANSGMYGIKAGYYFRTPRWLGLEAEFFTTSPHIKQQVQSFTNPSVSCGSACSATLQGAHFKVSTFAPLNIMFRYPKARLQPYLGFGPGIFFAKIKGEGLTPDSAASTSSNARLGLNAKIGVEYYFTRHFTAFAEWKYNYVKFNFKENTDMFPFPYGFNATYQMHLVAFGLALHF